MISAAAAEKVGEWMGEKLNPFPTRSRRIGAEDRNRTGSLLLGKETLYR